MGMTATRRSESGEAADQFHCGASGARGSQRILLEPLFVVVVVLSFFLRQVAGGADKAGKTCVVTNC